MITGQQFVSKIREIAAANPDYVYKAPEDTGGTCVYVEELPDGSFVGSCLLGQAMMALGADPKLIEPRNASTFTGLIAGRADIAWDEATVRWARHVQFFQDSKHTWFASVKYADRQEIK